MSSGGAASSRKGTAYEQELVRRFHADGWGALRLPSSGGVTDRDLPDILAGRPVVYPYGESERVVIEDRSDVQGDRFAAKLLAVELKAGKATTHYVGTDEVEALQSFARRIGARPFLGARYTTQGSGTGTYLVPPERARGPTDGGRLGLPVVDIDERAAWIVSDEGVRR